MLPPRYILLHKPLPGLRLWAPVELPSVDYLSNSNPFPKPWIYHCHARFFRFSMQ